MEEGEFEERVPEEVLIHLFSFLTVADIYSAQAVCKRWKRVVQVKIS